MARANKSANGPVAKAMAMRRPLPVMNGEVGRFACRDVRHRFRGAGHSICLWCFGYCDDWRHF